MLTEILQTLKLHQQEIEFPGGVNGGVNEILEYMAAHPGKRANAIAEALSISLRSVQRHLAQLKDEGRIAFRGAPRNGGYFRTDRN